MVDWIDGLTVSTAESTATFGVISTSDVAIIRSIAFLSNVDLGGEIRLDVHRRIGDKEGLRIFRVNHGKDVGDTPAGSQACIFLDDGAHIFIGVQAALHQRLDFTLAGKGHGLGCGGVAVGRVDDLVAGNIDAVFIGNGFDLCFRTNREPARSGSHGPLRRRQEAHPGCRG